MLRNQDQSFIISRNQVQSQVPNKSQYEQCGIPIRNSAIDSIMTDYPEPWQIAKGNLYKAKQFITVIGATSPVPKYLWAT
jgi:hypothetical protein